MLRRSICESEREEETGQNKASRSSRKSALFHSDRSDHLFGDAVALVDAVAVKDLVVHAALEEDVYVAFPRETDATVQLHRILADKLSRASGTDLRGGGCLRSSEPIDWR